MKEIKLFNPNDKPFGRLSNNSYHPITINGKNYPTITNYILSNMLSTPIWKQILQNTEISGAKGGNNELLKAIDFFINPFIYILIKFCIFWVRLEHLTIMYHFFYGRFKRRV